jgi:hypothetical protein
VLVHFEVMADPVGQPFQSAAPQRADPPEHAVPRWGDLRGESLRGFGRPQSSLKGVDLFQDAGSGFALGVGGLRTGDAGEGTDEGGEEREEVWSWGGLRGSVSSATQPLFRDGRLCSMPICSSRRWAGRPWFVER